MGLQTTVAIPSGDLQQIVYTFWWSERFGVVLDKCSHEARNTKRHKWVPYLYWDRISRRECTMDKPVVPENIKSAAVARIREQIVWGDK